MRRRALLSVIALALFAQSSTLALAPIGATAQVALVKFTPNDLPGGAATQLKVSLNASAPAGGVSVDISGLPGLTEPFPPMVVAAGTQSVSRTFIPPLLERAEAFEVIATDAVGSRSALLVVRPALRDVVSFGGSGTVGTGLLSPGVEAWPGRLQFIITNTAGLPQRVVNAGRGGRTTADGLNEIGTYLTPTASVLILALGANDYAKGIPIETTRSNLATMIALAQSKAMGVVLCGRIDMGQAYIDMWAELASTYATALVPDEDAGFVDGDRQADGHPTASGHIKRADTIWAATAPLLVV